MATETKASTAGRQIPIVCPGHTRPLAELQFQSIEEDGKQRTFLVSACHDKMPMLRDATSGDWIGTFAGHKGAVWCCRLDPMAYLAGTASGDFSARVWDGITGECLFTFPHKHIVKTLDFSPNSRYLATGGREGLLRIYDLTQQNDQNNNNNNNNNGVVFCAIPQVVQGDVTITKCVWWKDEIVIAAGSDGAIRYWRVLGHASPALVHELKVDAEVRDMEFSASTGILTVAAGNKVSFFDMKSNNDGYGIFLKSFPMPIHFREEGGASLHPSGSKFVAGGSDLWVRVFDFETGQELECHKGHHGPIRCVRYSPDGKTYATGSEDGTIRLWQTDPKGAETQ